MLTTRRTATGNEREDQEVHFVDDHSAMVTDRVIEMVSVAAGQFQDGSGSYDSDGTCAQHFRMPSVKAYQL